MRMKLLTTAAIAALFAGGGIAFAQTQPMTGPAGTPSAGQQTQQNEMNEQLQTRKHRAKPASQTEQSQPGAQEQSNPNGSATGNTQMRTNERMQNNTTNRTTINRTNVKITETQKTQLRRDIIESGRAPRAQNVNFQINVGVRVPQTVRVVAVPQEIVEINPVWASDEYFVAGDQIVIVDPATFEIVAVLPI